MLRPSRNGPRALTPNFLLYAFVSLSDMHALGQRWVCDHAVHV